MTRITDYIRQQTNLKQLQRNQSSLVDLTNQMNSGQKTDKFSDIAGSSRTLLDALALSSRSSQYLNNITTADTRLGLMDDNIVSAQNVAKEFMTELQNLASSTTPPQISSLAGNALSSLLPLLNASDGSRYLFSGSQLTSKPVQSLTSALVKSTSISSLANLPAAAPLNTSASQPTAGSYIDASFSGSEAAFDNQGNQYDVSVRFVKVSATTWQTYITGMKKAGTTIDATTPPLTVDTPQLVGAPFNPATQTTGTPFANFNFAAGTISTAPTASLQLNFEPNLFTATSVNGSSGADNATVTDRVVVNGNLSTYSPVGTVVTSNMSGAFALHDTNGSKYDVTVTYTKYADADPIAGTPDRWNTQITAITDSATGAVGTAVALPIDLGNFQTADGTAGTIPALTTISGGTLGPVQLRLGTVTTSATTSFISSVVDIPPLAPAAAQRMRLSANFDPAAPINNSVSNPTTGSFVDVTFTNAESVVDSGLQRHNLTVRYVHASTAPERWQAYVIGMTSAADGSASTNPAISANAPLAVGAPFDPATPPTTIGPISTLLRNGNALSVNIATGGTGGYISNTGPLSASRPENTTPIQHVPTTAINLAGNLDPSTAAGASVDIRLTGDHALVDAAGNVYNATVRLTKDAVDPSRWQASIVSLEDPATGAAVATVPALGGGLTIGPIFKPSDAASTTLNLTRTGVTVGGNALTLNIPINSTSFTTAVSGNDVTPGMQSTTTLATSVVDTSYFFEPGNKAANTSIAPLSVRVADDLTLTYGIRADNPGFEKIVRALTFFKDQSTPPTSADVQQALILLQDGVTQLTAARTDIANDRLTLKDQQTYHKTLTNLALDQEDAINKADPTEVSLKVTNLKTMIEASYSSLAIIKDLTLTNYLR